MDSLRAARTAASMDLTKRETDALEALCDTFVPSLAFEAGEDPALFSISARDMGVAEKVAQALDRIDSSKRSAFRLFLALLENPVFIASLVARAKPFSRLSLSARERMISASCSAWCGSATSIASA